ncbi:MAG: hypothetical protein JMDDDDMK_02486 [Acidobacteria bacterium]|nr:hypothetical protein [Acidobacteriota bacterium]
MIATAGILAQCGETSQQNGPVKLIWIGINNPVSISPVRIVESRSSARILP